MKPYLFVSAKGYNHEQALTIMDQQLRALHKDPKASGLEIFSCQIVPGMEMPEQKTVQIEARVPRQPVMVYYCTVLLVESRTVEGPTQKEIEDLLLAQKNQASFAQVCKHEPTNFRSTDHHDYATCLKCGMTLQKTALGWTSLVGSSSV